MVLPPDTPNATKMKKNECLEYLIENQIPHRSGQVSAVELKKLVRKHIKETEKPHVVQLAEQEGHKVLFTPPYHSDFQPIELVWAHIKGVVGRQYNIHTRLQDVLDRLDQQFDKNGKNRLCITYITD